MSVPSYPPYPSDYPPSGYRGPPIPYNSSPNYPNDPYSTPYVNRSYPGGPSEIPLREYPRDPIPQPSAAPVNTKLDEFLSSTPALVPYIPSFHSTGFSDLAFICSLDDESIEIMLDHVGADSERRGIPMKGGHRILLQQRFTQEKTRMKNDPNEPGALRVGTQRLTGLQRLTAKPQRKEESIIQRGPATQTINTAGRGEDVALAVSSPGNSRSKALEQRENRAIAQDTAQTSVESRNYIVAQGTQSVIKHWCFCGSFGILLIILAGALFGLYIQLRDDSTDYASTGSNSTSSSGGFRFLWVLILFGFSLGGLAILLCIFTWLRHPEQRQCQSIPYCGDWLNYHCLFCAADEENGCCGGPGPSLWEKLCAPNDEPGCLSKCQDSCNDRYKECCTSSSDPCCPSLQAKCCAPAAEEFNCFACMEDHGCGSLYCFDDCECVAPNFSCDCCPNCDGMDAACATCYKVVCCQCKIQVS